MKISNYIFSTSILWMVACSNYSESPEVPSVKEEESVINFQENDWDRASKLISGIPVESTYTLDTGYVESHASFMNEQFEKIRASRLSPLGQWMKTTVDSSTFYSESTVFYPFSGGDFIHMHEIYPHATNYVMMAIEPIGTIPNFKNLNGIQIDSALHESKVLLRDIFFRSYFITKHMQSDISRSRYVRGILPSILWGIVVSGHSILSVESVSINSDGVLLPEIVEIGSEFNKGVRITFADPDSKHVQTVTYLSCDISDSGFSSSPELRAYISSLGRFKSFVKAASYLMHYSTFSTIRSLLLDQSVFHLQDDTGIPFKFFNSEIFHSELYGHYVTPVSDFSENLFQPDLAKAYTDTDLFAGTLPFSMGYHWGTNLQNQMVFKRIE